MKLAFTMERARNLALSAIVVLNAIATIVSFAESYYGNYRWAEQHEITGLMGGIWPLMIDVIILVAEAGLFVAHHDGWKLRHKAWLWTVMMTALGVSVGANTGHILSADWLTHLTAALAPVALMFTTTVGFGVMKRTFAHKHPVIGPAREPSAAEVGQFRGTFKEFPRSGEKVHVGTAPWVESPALTEMVSPSETPLTDVSQQEVSTPETPDISATETSQDETPADSRLTDTLLSLGFKATEKSFTMPRDTREGISLAEKRVRDMYDVDPDISVNAIKNALGIAWATADKYLKATKEARGLTS
jgi:hypothetical protein